MANNLISFYKEGISMPQLNEGEYKVTLKSHTLVTTKPENPYITLEYVTESGRTLRENRFNQGFQIFISHLKQQLEMGDKEIGVQKFLDKLVADKTKFKLWVTKYTPANGGQTRSNFHLLEPRKITENTGITTTEINPTTTEVNPTANEIEDAI